jgi:hypothetical protein
VAGNRGSRGHLKKKSGSPLIKEAFIIIKYICIAYAVEYSLKSLHLLNYWLDHRKLRVISTHETAFASDVSAPSISKVFLDEIRLGWTCLEPRFRDWRMDIEAELKENTT